jgi:hypothetical protein
VEQRRVGVVRLHLELLSLELPQQRFLVLRRDLALALLELRAGQLLARSLDASFGGAALCGCRTAATGEGALVLQ